MQFHSENSGGRSPLSEKLYLTEVNLKPGSVVKLFPAYYISNRKRQS